MRQYISHIVFCSVALGMMLGISFAHAAGKIVSGCSVGAVNISTEGSEHYAWSDVIGWIDFLYSGNPNVEVSTQELMGCANSDAVGLISLNCRSTPNNDICSTSSYKVSNQNDGSLAGWAWNDTIGWISFCGNATESSTLTGGNWRCPSALTYQVFIDSTGDFHGWAWSDVVGWISFNCFNTGTCADVDYKVHTEWTSTTPPPSNTKLLSSVFNACAGNETYCQRWGAMLTLLWQGSVSGGQVKFQIASSRCFNGAPDPFPNTAIPGDRACNNDDPTITTQAQIDALNMWCEGDSCLNCSTSFAYQNDPQGTKSCFLGPDGFPYSYYITDPNTPILLTAAHHNDKRYVRYKVVLDRHAVPGPRVDDVIISWSR